MSRPRAATSVATRIDPVVAGEEKRSMDRMRAFCAIWEWSACAGRLRFCNNGVRRLTECIEFVKIRVRWFGWYRSRA